MKPLTIYTIELGQPVSFIGNDNKEKSYPAGVEYDITKDVQSWTDMDLISQRNGLSGIITEVLSDIIIVETARVAADVTGFQIIEAMFNTYSVRAKVTMRIYQHENITENHVLRKAINLDFKKYQWKDRHIAINGVALSLTEVLSAKKNTKYDILFDDSVKLTKPFRYTPINIHSIATYQLPLDVDLPITYGAAVGTYTHSLQVSFAAIETVTGNSIGLARSQTSKWMRPTEPQDTEYFFEAQKNMDVLIRGNFKIGITGRINQTPTQIVLVKFNADGTTTDMHTFGVVEDSQNPLYHYSTIDFNQEISLNTGDRMFFCLRIGTTSLTTSLNYKFESFEYLKVEWMQTSGQNLMFGVTTPEKLLNTLLNKMSTEGAGYTGRIEWEENMVYAPLLCPADSIRGIKKQYIHTSFSDFNTWMFTKGYNYTIIDKEIIYRKIDNFYNKAETSMQIPKKECGNLRIIVNEERVYTRIEVGQQKVDYDKANGKYEVNGLFEYTTGIENDDNVLNLLSPYRRDHYGMEFLSWKRWEESKDDKSDNDLWEIASSDNGMNYYFYNGVRFRQQAEGLEGNIYFYNAIVSPYHTLLENEALVGVCTNLAEFASASNNREGVIIRDNGVSIGNIYANVPIAKKLFDMEMYVLDIGTIKNLPDNRDGLCHFTYWGKQYKGFLYEARQNYSRPKTEEWQFLALKD